MSLTEQRPTTTVAGDLRFGVLGPLLVERAGRAIDPGGLKQRAVLTLLLLNANRPLSVERMVEELWGEETPRTAVATLQAYISNLRRILEPDRPARAPAAVLVRRIGSYELTADPDSVDALRFERLAAEGADRLARDPSGARLALEQALALWRGPALVEFRTFEFVDSEVQRLDEVRITARENRVAADLALGRSGELIAELEQLVNHHPLRERLWGQLMQAYYRTGRQAEALRTYRRCEQLLADELGIVPSSELRALELAVLEQDPTLTVAQPIIDAGGLRVGPPLEIVGRDHEMLLLQEAVRRAEGGRGTVILIDGEAGVGKTRLIEAMHETAGRLGCRSALARCVEVGGSPPFWPWLQLLRSLDDNEGEPAGRAGSLARYLLPADYEPPPESEPGSAGPRRYRVADGLVEAMHELGAARPIVVFVDDLYCADPDSVSVLALIGAALAKERVVLVGTYRSGRPSTRHPLVDVIVQLSRLDWCERIHLSGFDRGEVGDLVERVVGATVESETVDAIHRRTEGNAFYTVELARLLLTDARQQLPTGDFASLIPDTVKEVVSRRLSVLPPEALTMTRVAAISGRTFDIAIVAEAAGASIQSALDLADAAVLEDIVHEAGPPGHYRFSHVLMVETIVAGLGALRRAQLHDSIANALEARFGHDSERWHDIAHHRVEAVPIAGVDPAIEALARAGRRATAVNALELADQLLMQRHAFVMRKPPSAERDRAELESLFDRSVVWTWRDGYQSPAMRQAADRMLELTQPASPEVTIDTSTETGTRHGVLQALQAHCSFEIVAGNVRGSTDVAEMMLALAETNPHPFVGAVANINATVAAILRGGITDAVAHAERTDELLMTVDPDLSGTVMMPLGQQSLAVTHYAFSGWAHRMNDDRHRARVALRQGRLVADRSRHAFSRAFHASIECAVATIDHSPEWVEDVLQWHGDDPEVERFEFLDASLDLYRTWVAGMAGDPTAAPRLRNAVQALNGRGAGVSQTLHWAMVAELQLVARRPKAALRATKAGIARASHHGERFWYPELERLAARAYDRLGDLPARDSALGRAEAATVEMGVGTPAIHARSPSELRSGSKPAG